MKIPKYVYELVELGRLRPAPLDEQANSSIAGQGEYGYMFRVYRKSNSQSGGVLPPLRLLSMRSAASL